MWQRVWVTILIVLMMQPWGAYRAFGADITPGYTFSSGEANVTHTKLNNSAAGTINTTFYSGKSSAGSDPSTAFELLLRDTSLDTFKRTTLAAGVFDHSALLNSRAAKTVPVIADTVLISDSAAGNAYKQMTWTNWMFAGAGTGTVTNDTRFPALRAGVAASLTLSNLIGAAFTHDTPTNGDSMLVLTENHNAAVRKMSLQTMITASWPGTNYSGTDMMLMHDGTRLRSMRGTNFIDGLTVTNTAPGTGDVFVVMQAGVLKKLFMNELRLVTGYQNIQQSTYTVTTNIAATSGNWSNVTTIGTSTLSNAITPRATSSKILVRVVLQAASEGGSENGYLRILRNGSAIGVGDTAGSRTSAGATIENTAANDAAACVYEWLDSPATISEVTYNVQVGGVTGNTIYINRDLTDADSAANGRFVSTLTLTEILQ
jgi:hypothetical protein